AYVQTAEQMPNEQFADDVEAYHQTNREEDDGSGEFLTLANKIAYLAQTEGSGGMIWQAIETAPKDCTNLLLANHDIVFTGWWFDGNDTDTGEPGWIDGSTTRYGQYHTYHPTHW